MSKIIENGGMPQRDDCSFKNRDFFTKKRVRFWKQRQQTKQRHLKEGGILR